MTRRHGRSFVIGRAQWSIHEQQRRVTRCAAVGTQRANGAQPPARIAGFIQGDWTMKKILIGLTAAALLATSAMASAQTTPPAAEKPADAPAKKTHKKKKAAEGDAAKTDKAAEPAKK
jgi:hypothetical protein